MNPQFKIDQLDPHSIPTDKTGLIERIRELHCPDKVNSAHSQTFYEASLEEGNNMNSTQNLTTITLGGGCFWCLEAVFQRVRGVHRVVSGYAGGTAETANYQAVCSGATQHIEVVQVTFDVQTVGLEQILDVFFAVHDPTTLNRQGNDVGYQYRSVIFFESSEQEVLSRDKINRLNQRGGLAGPIVTSVEPLDVFFPAEDYHQNYFNSNPRQPYCQLVVGEKVRKLLTQFPDQAVEANSTTSNT